MGKVHDVAFIGDLHFGHLWAAKTRGFETVDAHDEEVIARFNSVVGKKTLVFILGDIAMDKKHYYKLLQLNGRKILIPGNHDKRENMKELATYFETVAADMEYKGCIATHMPIHPQENRYYMLNIHAHTHNSKIMRRRYQPGSITVHEEEDPNYFCVSWEQLDGIPISFKEIMEQKKDNKWTV